MHLHLLGPADGRRHPVPQPGYVAVEIAVHDAFRGTVFVPDDIPKHDRLAAVLRQLIASYPEQSPGRSRQGPRVIPTGADSEHQPACGPVSN